ncbi:MAG: hypothetical protein HGA96_07195 [Desulfobulbaceae bacterium]|nr:hypothetical protein [Desulfobulbaceae bacterium]
MDNRESSALLSRLDRGETLPDSVAAASSSACVTQLLTACQSDIFRPELPNFRLLCRLATAANQKTAALTTSHIYRQLVEPLCDDFSATACDQIHQVLAGLIAFIATTSNGRALGELLAQCQLNGPNALFNRWRRLTSPAGFPAPAELNKVETILIPSRITAGADVAITSVLLQRLATARPEAEIILLGPAHLRELFHGLPQVQHLPFEIDRHGNLAARLLFWPDLVTTTTAALAGRPADRVLVVDPDSRLTQLGLLPLFPGARTCHFPSQILTGPPGHASLSALANAWLDNWLGRTAPAFPRVAPAPAKVAAADSFCGRLRAAGSARLLLVNLGVGGDLRKSLPEEFERQLLDMLLATENTIIILDMGCGSEEKVKAEKLVEFLAAAGRKTAQVEDKELALRPAPFRHGVIGLCSSIGTLAALTSGVDCYLGYDSCGQHLANGADAAAITLFTGFPTQRFLERWSPLSRSGRSFIVPVPDRNPSPATSAALLELITGIVNRLPTRG